jgi:hypothetical protein
MSKGLLLLLAYLAGSFFGIGQIISMFRGMATPKTAPAAA